MWAKQAHEQAAWQQQQSSLQGAEPEHVLQVDRKQNYGTEQRHHHGRHEQHRHGEVSRLEGAQVEQWEALFLHGDLPKYKYRQEHGADRTPDSGWEGSGRTRDTNVAQSIDKTAEGQSRE